MKKTHKTAALIVFLLVGILVGFALYQRRQEPERDLRSLLSTISSMILLPDELPTIATVTDRESLPSQQFFTNAQNGDVVLIYINAQRAILYRPSLKKIVEMAPVFVQSEADGAVPGLSVSSPMQPTPSVSPEPDQISIEPITSNIVLLNGSESQGVTLGVQQRLLEAFPGLQIINRLSANQSDYDETLVIDLTGNNADDARRLADALEARMGVLPESEVRPSADIVILIGNDR